MFAAFARSKWKCVRLIPSTSFGWSDKLNGGVRNMQDAGVGHT